MNFIKKIDNKISRVRTIDLFSNLAAGLIGGTVIYFFSLTMPVLVKQFEINKLILVLAYPTLFYLSGLVIIMKISSEINCSLKKQMINYHLNLLAAIIGAGYLLVAFVFFPVTSNHANILWNLLALLIMLTILITISYLRKR